MEEHAQRFQNIIIKEKIRNIKMKKKLSQVLQNKKWTVVFKLMFKNYQKRNIDEINFVFSKQISQNCQYNHFFQLHINLFIMKNPQYQLFYINIQQIKNKKNILLRKQQKPFNSKLSKFKPIQLVVGKNPIPELDPILNQTNEIHIQKNNDMKFYQLSKMFYPSFHKITAVDTFMN
ncbi:unnamed protein product [Paramecium pentaurelia]|uniref:Uncharacterized protein n=1 Tax=Paramecium pentaurelia TaxID=43138 RepID=A0A8S1TV43_9CILI|nr:unnamed protein product [Paramecium pentaurelia]